MGGFFLLLQSQLAHGAVHHICSSWVRRNRGVTEYQQWYKERRANNLLPYSWPNVQPNANPSLSQDQRPISSKRANKFTRFVIEMLDALERHACKLIELIMRFQVIRDLLDVSKTLHEIGECNLHHV